MCEYCSDGESISNREYSNKTDAYVEFDASIDGNVLNIVCCTNIGTMSQGTTYLEKDIKINYCPMCGRKLNNDK
ncbi:MAG TPA: hypothetical protein VN258_06360 [Mobilitalea sp.]|nr:hypothetical protein [Mobilitalea sp.]